MRDLALWDESDLQSLIDNAVEENLNLDYKQSDSLGTSDGKKNEIAKDVSAFANSAGGRIIYGIIEQNQKPISIDAGVIDPKVTREWLEQVINSKIHPRISGIYIKPIQISTSSNYAYAVDIPQSKTNAPHQSSDNKYYKRFNFQSVPMEDFEVKDVMRRSSTGSPIVWFQSDSIVKNSDGSSTATISSYITNRLSEPVMYASLFLSIDSRLVDEKFTLGYEFSYNRTNPTPYLLNSYPLFVTVFSKNHSIPGSMPIYKEVNYLMARIKDIIVPADGVYVLGYRIACPGFSYECIGSFLFSQGNLVETSSFDLLNPSRN